MKRQGNITGKQEDLLAAARELFFRFGIRRVSVEEICREAKVSKMSFYRFFKNKNAIVINILEEIVDNIMDTFDTVMKEKTKFTVKMEKLIDIKIKIIETFSTEFFKELLDDKSEAGQFLLNSRKEMAELARKVYTDAQKRGEIRRDINIDLILYMTEHFHSILKDDKLHAMYTDTPQLVRELSRFYLYGMAGK